MSNTGDPTVVHVSQKGQATIPKPLRKRFGIDTPGEVFVYEAAGRIVVEPVPSLDDLHGVHSGDRDQGDVLAAVRELRANERQREADRIDRVRPSQE